MSFPERIGIFLLYLFFALITGGVYVLYHYVTRTEEQNKLLYDIRAALTQDRTKRADKDMIDFH